MANWFKIYDFINLLRQPSPKNNNSSEKYLPYGAGDCWPLEWSQVISESPTGKSCLSTVTDFLEGDGFSEKDLEKLKINRDGETFWEIHQKTAASFSEFEGFAWLLKYNAVGKITELFFLPFENVRLGKPDDNGYISKIYYNPFFGTPEYNGVNKKATIEYYVFNPENVTTQIIDQKDKFKGQVLYVGTTTTLSRFYPLHEAVSSKRAMKIENNVSVYHDENLGNGMLQPFLLVMKGNPNEPSTNPDYSNYAGEGKPATVAQEFDEVVGQNFMGAKRIGNMWVQWVNNPDEKPEVVTLPTNNSVDLFNTLDASASKKITLAWKVPSVLANINEGASLGGDGNLIRVSVKLMQQRSIRKQRLLTENYDRILKLMGKTFESISITPYNPYPEMETVDAQIWNELSVDERREWIKNRTDIELIENEVIAPEQSTGFNNSIPVKFPDAVKQTINKALKYQEQIGLKCSTKGGLDVSNQILNDSHMGLKQLKRLHSYLKKRNNLKDKPYSDGCDIVQYNAWGGSQMFDFLDTKLNDIDAWLN